MSLFGNVMRGAVPLVVVAGLGAGYLFRADLLAALQVEGGESDSIGLATVADWFNRLTGQGDASYYVKQGQEQNRKGLFDDAIKSFSQALKLDQQSKDAKIGLADAYKGKAYRAKDECAADTKVCLDDAIKNFTAAIDALKNEDTAAYVGRGWTYFDQGAYDKAIADFSQAIAIVPDDSNLYLARGYARDAKATQPGSGELNEQSRVQLESAINDFKRALELTKADDWIRAKTYSWRGATYGHAESYALAYADFDEAKRRYVTLLGGADNIDSGLAVAGREHRSEYGRLHMYWGVTLREDPAKEMTFKQAIENLEEAAKRAPADSEIQYELGQTYYLIGQNRELNYESCSLSKWRDYCGEPLSRIYGKAKEYFTLASALNDQKNVRKQANFAYSLGQSYQKLGDDVNARIQFENARSLDPSLEDATSSITPSGG